MDESINFELYADFRYTQSSQHLMIGSLAQTWCFINQKSNCWHQTHVTTFGEHTSLLHPRGPEIHSYASAVK